jgi:uncharacterized protein YciI
MFIVLLKLTADKTKIAPLMEEHKAWLQRGFEAGVFLLSGTIEPGLGGAILARDSSVAALEARLAEDPFVREDVVRPEIIEVSPSRLDPRLETLFA